MFIQNRSPFIYTIAIIFYIFAGIVSYCILDTPYKCEISCDKRLQCSYKTYNIIGTNLKSFNFVPKNIKKFQNGDGYTGKHLIPGMSKYYRMYLKDNDEYYELGSYNLYLDFNAYKIYTAMFAHILLTAKDPYHINKEDIKNAMEIFYKENDTEKQKLTKAKEMLTFFTNASQKYKNGFYKTGYHASILVSIIWILYLIFLFTKLLLFDE